MRDLRKGGDPIFPLHSHKPTKGTLRASLVKSPPLSWCNHSLRSLPPSPHVINPGTLGFQLMNPGDGGGTNIRPWYHNSPFSDLLWNSPFQHCEYVILSLVNKKLRARKLGSKAKLRLMERRVEPGRCQPVTEKAGCIKNEVASQYGKA